jgi:hypothetical protein
MNMSFPDAKDANQRYRKCNQALERTSATVSSLHVIE